MRGIVLLASPCAVLCVKYLVICNLCFHCCLFTFLHVCVSVKSAVTVYVCLCVEQISRVFLCLFPFLSSFRLLLKLPLSGKPPPFTPSSLFHSSHQFLPAIVFLSSALSTLALSWGCAFFESSLINPQTLPSFHGSSSNILKASFSLVALLFPSYISSTLFHLLFVSYPSFFTPTQFPFAYQWENGEEEPDDEARDQFDHPVPSSPAWEAVVPQCCQQLLAVWLCHKLNRQREFVKVCIFFKIL